MPRLPLRITRRRLIWAIPLGVLLLLAGLFVLNGLMLAWGETPLVGQTSVSPVAELASSGSEASASTAPTIKILAYNLAKGFVHQGGISFASQAEVTARMQAIAAVIKEQQPDLVFLSEVVWECSPTRVNQVKFLAEQTGMASYAFGENFNFGLPGYRITSGNAILSRAELTPVANPSLAGRQPFYITKNNRRTLFCRVRILGHEVLLGSIHTDSFNLENNLAQTQQILDFCGNDPTILAGDFNCQPSEPGIQLMIASGKFSGSTENVHTFPADQPNRRLDYIFVPASWEFVEEQILPGTASDHRAVVSSYRVKW